VAQKRAAATANQPVKLVILTVSTAASLGKRKFNPHSVAAQARIPSLLLPPTSAGVAASLGIDPSTAAISKIVKDVDEALERIHQVAAPINARRHYLKHHYDSLADLPCVRTGRCVDCTHDEKICCYTVIIEGAMSSEKDRINVVLVGEELGI